MKASLPAPDRVRIAVAALSARNLVTLAAAEGFAPDALDLFADADTRSVARCIAIGAADGTGLDARRLHGALTALAAGGDCLGWIAGSGFEMHLDLLESAAQVLPLIGNTPEVVRKARTPGFIYPLFAELGVPHPQTLVVPPPDPAGWLLKNAHACGGWHVRAAPEARHGPLPPGAYFQRKVDGVPMSALFLADGHDAVLLGVARQTVRPLGRRRWVFHGGLGPAALPGHIIVALQAFAARISAAMGLVGLNGLDFMLDGDAPSVIELNARPTAAINLFADALAEGLVKAHVATSQGARLSCFTTQPTRPRGFEVVFADMPGRVCSALHEALRDVGWCADIPMPGTVFERRGPVCTVLADGDSLADVESVLALRVARVHSLVDGLAGDACGAEARCDNEGCGDEAGG